MSEACEYGCVCDEWDDYVPPWRATPEDQEFDDFVQKSRDMRPLVQRAHRRLAGLRLRIAAFLQAYDEARP